MHITLPGQSPPRFSIITVCFNAMPVLPGTVLSLRSQTCRNYEWIVIDGASTDGSVNWLVQQAPNTFVTEGDKGIYDAMNKALACATGEWVFFLNAGDRFADSNVLADVSAAIDTSVVHPTGPAVIYGDVVYFNTKSQRRRRFHWLTRKRLLFGDLCHQATFVKRDSFEVYGNFDISLRFNADFDWFIRAFRARAPLLYIARDIAFFQDAGTHVAHHQICEAERDQVRARYCPRPLWLLGHWLLRVELKLRRLTEERNS